MEVFNPISGAYFSEDKKHRFVLWRVWDTSRPRVLIIGLNPSTANDTNNDPTVKRIVNLIKFNGYGGFHLVNCFSFITPYPNCLKPYGFEAENKAHIDEAAKSCAEAVFAWGNFSIVSERYIDRKLQIRFPKALCFGINKNGTPKHPLYLPAQTSLITFPKII